MYSSGDKLNFDRACIRLKDHAYCPICEKLVRLVAYDDAAAMFKTDADDIHSLALNGELHRLHDHRARILICTDSLFSCFDQRQTRLLSHAAITAK